MRKNSQSIKNIFRGSLIFLILLLLGACTINDESIDNIDDVRENNLRVAAVGDSITAEFTDNAGYPMYLDEMLSEEYVVVNFGQSNHAAQSSSDYPYETSDAYSESIEFEPHLVLIMLGTNDTKGRNWSGIERFKNEYKNLVENYIELESVARVVLISPPSVFTDSTFGLSINQRYIEPIRDAVEEVAEEYELEFIDMVTETAEHSEWFYDGIHPTPEGAEELAKIIYEQMEQ